MNETAMPHSTSDFNDKSRDRLMENVQNLANHADELLKATASVSSEGVALARENLTDSLRSVRSQLGHLQDLAVDRARQAVQATDTFVRRNPWQAVGIAVAVGLVASILGVFSRRNATR